MGGKLTVYFMHALGLVGSSYLGGCVCVYFFSITPCRCV